jgi:uncharacterized protein (TIGR01244 family)
MLPRSLLALAVIAVPVFASDPVGVGNFHKVNDRVYRGAQPTPEGFRNLAELGIKTVIDLRGDEHSIADEKQWVEAAGMKYVSVPMKGMQTPGADQIAAALKILNDDSAGPVFVHCKRGADRTGAVIACYRIGHDHWDSARALDEATNYGMSWYQLQIRRFVARYNSTGTPVGIPALVVP